MLIAILNTCTREELEEEDEAEEEEDQPLGLTSPTGEPLDPEEEAAERRQAVKNKILAIGRMSRVFALMREDAEKSSELTPLRISTSDEGDVNLTSGAEEVKQSIHGFGDARRSDIENEHLPPDLIEVRLVFSLLGPLRAAHGWHLTGRRDGASVACDRLALRLAVRHASACDSHGRERPSDLDPSVSSAPPFFNAEL